MNLGGVFVAIELKSEGGKASKLQEYNLTEIAASGGIAIILEPANEEEVLDFLSTVASIGVVGKNEVLRRDS